MALPNLPVLIASPTKFVGSSSSTVSITFVEGGLNNASIVTITIITRIPYELFFLILNYLFI